jgi:hypothetical protein
MSVVFRLSVNYLSNEYIFSGMHNRQECRKLCTPDRIMHGSKLEYLYKDFRCYFLLFSIVSNYQRCLTCRSSDVTLTLCDPGKSEYLGEIHLSATLWPRSQEDKDQVSDVTLTPE